MSFTCLQQTLAGPHTQPWRTSLTGLIIAIFILFIQRPSVFILLDVYADFDILFFT